MRNFSRILEHRGAMSGEVIKKYRRLRDQIRRNRNAFGLGDGEAFVGGGQRHLSPMRIGPHPGKTEPGSQAQRAQGGVENGFFPLCRAHVADLIDVDAGCAPSSDDRTPARPGDRADQTRDFSARKDRPTSVKVKREKTHRNGVILAEAILRGETIAAQARGDGRVAAGARENGANGDVGQTGLPLRLATGQLSDEGGWASAGSGDADDSLGSDAEVRTNQTRAKNRAGHREQAA